MKKNFIFRPLFILIATLVIFIFFIIANFVSEQTSYKNFIKNNVDYTLYQEYFDNDKQITIYKNKDDLVSYYIQKRNKILIQGDFSYYYNDTDYFEEKGYVITYALIEYYNKIISTNEYTWLIAGTLYNDNITNVLINNTEATIVDTEYGRVFYYVLNSDSASTIPKIDIVEKDGTTYEATK